MISDLVASGVRVRILDQLLGVHRLAAGGYRLCARYRVALLKLGIELREMRPKLGQRHARFHPFRSSNASLHAKALVIDQKIVFIGSLNMDERSARINSELGLVINSADIARQVTSLLDDHQHRQQLQAAIGCSSGRVEWVERRCRRAEDLAHRSGNQPDRTGLAQDSHAVRA